MALRATSEHNKSLSVEAQLASILPKVDTSLAERIVIQFLVEIYQCPPPSLRLRSAESIKWPVCGCPAVVVTGNRNALHAESSKRLLCYGWQWGKSVLTAS
uniref:Uncharacterized protein n=1 Tax=Salmonella sp. TaxID=599 RepID=A0A482EWZ7_SALSP|nr:hypothetical protein NNIBIDOC_00022 [Salmonella sp.]